jgi:hypothetical protein
MALWWIRTGTWQPPYSNPISCMVLHQNPLHRYPTTIRTISCVPSLRAKSAKWLQCTVQQHFAVVTSRVIHIVDSHVSPRGSRAAIYICIYIRHPESNGWSIYEQSPTHPVVVNNGVLLLLLLKSHAAVNHDIGSNLNVFNNITTTYHIQRRMYWRWW